MNEENDGQMAGGVSQEEAFYHAVAEALGCDHPYIKPLTTRRNRWNNRYSGNGRYEGHGLVRRFSASHILVRLHTPPVSGLYGSEDEALAAIPRLVP